MVTVSIGVNASPVNMEGSESPKKVSSVDDCTQDCRLSLRESSAAFAERKATLGPQAADDRVGEFAVHGDVLLAGNVVTFGAVGWA